MEFSKLGDMRHAIQRLEAANRHLPSEALWLIFDCLVKACIAMEYPPRYVTAGPILDPDGDYLPEVIPPGGQAAPANGFRGVVHFDLDPQNSRLHYSLLFPSFLCLKMHAKLLEISSISIRIRPTPHE